MTCNFLLLNLDKTEVIVLGPKHLRSTLPNDIVMLDDIALASSTTVRNLGVISAQHGAIFVKGEMCVTIYFYIKYCGAVTSSNTVLKKHLCLVQVSAKITSYSF